MKLETQALNQLFRDARTYSHWQDRAVEPALLKELFDLVKMGPTGVNSGPGRFVFVASAEGKERLLKGMAQGNLEKTRTAPVSVIVGYDVRFYDQLPKLFPHADARSWFVDDAEMAKNTALQNANLQAGYLILAARSLGLDVGPMAGFDAEKLNSEFFPDGRTRAILVCNLGYGDSSKLHPRLPRLGFEEACQIV